MHLLWSLRHNSFFCISFFYILPISHLLSSFLLVYRNFSFVFILDLNSGKHSVYTFNSIDGAPFPSEEKGINYYCFIICFWSFYVLSY